jgi:heat shock protein HslJ
MNTMSIRLLAIAALLGALAIAGCQSGDSLTGPTWQWTAQPAAEASESYTIEFRTDGTVEIGADCNNLTGTYTVGIPLDLTIDVATRELAECGDQSQDDLFLENLSRVSSYSTGGGMLSLYFADEAVAMQFAVKGS